MIDVSIHPGLAGPNDVVTIDRFTIQNAHWVTLRMNHIAVVQIFATTRDQADRLADLLNEIAGRKKAEDVPEHRRC